ncbi:hypothetical protein V1522DRAFT_445733 [Lipomyces starkeyi]
MTSRSTTTRNTPSPISDYWDKHRGKRLKSDSSPEFTTSTTTVSSTTSVTLSTDMSPVRDEKERSDYDQALYLLENNPPEQRFDFHLPYSQYLKLEECWSKIKSARNISEDQKYKPLTCICFQIVAYNFNIVGTPILAYNSCAEYVTVITVPRDLFAAGFYLGKTILAGAEEHLSSHAANAILASRIVYVGSTTTTGSFDGTLKYKRAGAMHEIMIAIEFGYKMRWIDGQHKKVCILVCLDESPRFRNPGTQHENVGDVIGECKAVAQAVAETVERDTSLGYYGHIEYQGHTWVGNLKEAFIEVWRAKKRHPTRSLSSLIGLNSRGQPSSHTFWL